MQYYNGRRKEQGTTMPKWHVNQWRLEMFIPKVETCGYSLRTILLGADGTYTLIFIDLHYFNKIYQWKMYSQYPNDDKVNRI